MNNGFEKQECILRIGQNVGQIVTGLCMTAVAILGVIKFMKNIKEIKNRNKDI